MITEVRQTLPFYYEEVAHSSSRTLVSGKIEFFYEIEGVWFSFKKNCQDYLRVKVFYSSDDQATDGVEPKDTNILPPYVHTEYIVGSDTTFFLPMYAKLLIKPSYLKVYGNNTDNTYTHILDTKIVIRALEEI